MKGKCTCTLQLEYSVGIDKIMTKKSFFSGSKI